MTLRRVPLSHVFTNRFHCGSEINLFINLIQCHRLNPPPPPDFFSPLAQLLFLKSRYLQMLISVLSSSLFPSCPSLLHHLLRSLPFSLFPSPPFPLFFLRLQSAMISSVRRPPRQLSWSHLLVMSSPGLELSHPSGLFCILFVWGFFCAALYYIYIFMPPLHPTQQQKINLNKDLL